MSPDAGELTFRFEIPVETQNELKIRSDSVSNFGQVSISKSGR